MVEDKKLIINKRSFDVSFYEMELEFDNSSIINFLKNYNMAKEKMLTTYYTNTNVLEEIELLQFKDHINSHVYFFVKDVIKKENFFIKDSWFQAYEPNSYHSLHIHGNTEKDWSMIYYVQTSPQSSRTNIFMPGFPYVPEVKKHITPKKDKLVIFPSYFPHEVEPNKDDSRIIFSANFVVS